MNKSAGPHQGSESNTTESQLRCHVKPALRDIWSRVSLESNNSNQLCDVQTSQGKWSNDWEKIYLQKQTNKKLKRKKEKKKQKPQNPDYWKNCQSRQVCISYQPMQGSSTKEA